MCIRHDVSPAVRTSAPDAASAEHGALLALGGPWGVMLAEADPA